MTIPATVTLCTAFGVAGWFHQSGNAKSCDPNGHSLIPAECCGPARCTGDGAPDDRIDAACPGPNETMASGFRLSSITAAEPANKRIFNQASNAARQGYPGESGARSLRSHFGPVDRPVPRVFIVKRSNRAPSARSGASNRLSAPVTVLTPKAACSGRPCTPRSYAGMGRAVARCRGRNRSGLTNFWQLQ